MPGICDGGTCMNTDGGVICDCPEGFVLSSNGMKCIDTRQDHCYDKFLSGQYNIWYNGLQVVDFNHQGVVQFT